MKQAMQAEKLDQENRLKERMSLIRHKIIVMSGKGGVGKTSVAVNLSYAFATSGKKVGLLDTDLHGPNVAKMLGVEKESLGGSTDGIDPVRVLPELKVVSLAFVAQNPDVPIHLAGSYESKHHQTASRRSQLGDAGLPSSRLPARHGRRAS